MRLGVLDYLQQINEAIFFFINKNIANSLFDFLMPIVRNPNTWVPLYIVAVILLFFKFKLKACLVLLGVIILVFITDYGSSSIIKHIYAMPRPCNNLALKEHVRLLVHCGSGYGFISTHAANHFGLAAFFSSCLTIRRKYLVYIMFAWAFIISIAQIYVGVHYPGDVLVGAIYGSCFGLAIGSITRNLLTGKYM